MRRCHPVEQFDVVGWERDLGRGDVLLQVRGRGLPLADRDRVGIAELADDDWISWSSGQICHDWLVHALRRAGSNPRIRHAASEHATQVAMVAAGLGVAIIPRLGRDPVPPTVRIVPIEPMPVRRIFAVRRSSVTARPAIQAVLDALQRVAFG